MTEQRNANPKRFIEFIEEIVSNGDWEYGDGAPMTEDAKAVLAMTVLTSTANELPPDDAFLGLSYER